MSTRNQELRDRELRWLFTKGLGELRPAAIKQILEMDLGLNMPVFRDFTLQLISQSCSQFIMHARKWTANSEMHVLQTMCDYDALWEGYSCDEPYFDSKGRKLKYFMDRYLPQREREMEAQFVTLS